VLSILKDNDRKLYGRDRSLGESFWPKSESPAVGSYSVRLHILRQLSGSLDNLSIYTYIPIIWLQLPRIMSHQTPGSEIGIEISSSFKTSGRSKEIMDNCKYFKTTHEELKASNIGPGSYDYVPSYMGQQMISPTIKDVTFRSKIIHPDNHLFPPKLTVKPPLPKLEKKVSKRQAVIVSEEERDYDVRSVRNLPELPLY